jgi:protein-tyrosine phosphatase
MQTLLFLCTGNYYRSRFAEHLFNALASKHGLNWMAISRGLALEWGVDNVGAISKYALTGLIERQVSMAQDLRYPLPLTEADLAGAAKIIAVDESEHRPLMLERFPKWTDAIEYWLVHDVGHTPVDEALQQIEDHIQQLIEQIRN